MAVPDDFAEALGELEDVIPATFVWPLEGYTGSTEYPCFTGIPKKNASLESGGFNVNTTIKVLVRRNLFGTSIPAFGQKFSHRGTTYRTEEVQRGQGDAFLRITGVDISRGA